MPNPTTATVNPALLPSPALFDVTAIAAKDVEGTIERIALDRLELAPNARRDISQEGIERLAGMLSRTGQLVPCIGHRANPAAPVVLYDGQRRLLAAKASHELAGGDGFEGLEPVRSLIVLLLDHRPAPDEVRRIQAQVNNAREDLSLLDQQEQLRDCWEARAGLPETDRIAAVCADLGISAKKAHNLRRQLTLPDPIRARVAERPSGEQLSVTMANRLADMHKVAPELTEAVARRITSSDLHEKAQRDLGGFVHRTVIEDERTYAVRIDDGALLDAAEQIEHARSHLAPAGRQQLAGILGVEPDKLDSELDTLSARAKTRALKLRITPEVRDRARTGRYAFVHERGQDFAAGIWVVDPAFMIDLAREALQTGSDEPARDEAFFAGAQIDDDELRNAAEEDRQRKQQRPAAPRRGDPKQPRTRARHPRRTDRPHRQPAARTQGDHLPAARPPLPRADRLRRRLDRPGPPTARRRHRPPRTPPHRRDPRRRTATRARRSRPAARDRPADRPLGRGVRARPRRRHPNQGARHRAHRPQAPRRAPRRPQPTPHRRVGVPAADALPHTRRAQPRRVHHRRERREQRRPRQTPLSLRPRRARPRRFKRGRVRRVRLPDVCPAQRRPCRGSALRGRHANEHPPLPSWSVQHVR